MTEAEQQRGVALSIVVAALNEAHSLPHLVSALLSSLARIAQPAEVELLVVDDGSQDGTWEAIAALAARARDGSQGLDSGGSPGLSVRGLRFSRNFGKEAAILAGLEAATGEAVIVMDADLQHPPTLIPTMVTIWREQGVAVVEAVKRERQAESAWRRLMARGFYQTLLIGAGLDLRDSTDFKLLDRGVVDAYLAMPERGRFFRGLVAWIALPTARLEIEVPERKLGSGSWSLRALLALARRGIVNYTALPLRLVSWLGLAGMLISVVLILQTLVVTWMGGAREGFPTVIILILTLGSMILIGLGIIGEYLAEIYAEVKGRPHYVLRETLGWAPGTPGRFAANDHSAEPDGEPSSLSTREPGKEQKGC